MGATLVLATAIPRAALAQTGPETAASAPAAASQPSTLPAAAGTAPVAPSATAPPAAPARAAPAGTAPRAVTSPSHALVHVAVNYRDAWLETRSYVDAGPFVRTCATPCDISLQVDGLEARVVAPGMTTSNVFRFDGGSGRAGVRVDGGSSTARTAGIVALGAGIPLALAGMALLAQGNMKDASGMRAAGVVGLAVGGSGILAALPLLLMGTTSVKDSRGERIAGAARERFN